MAIKAGAFLQFASVIFFYPKMLLKSFLSIFLLSSFAVGQETFRLPRDSVPLSYSLTLTLDIGENFSNFNGRAEILVRITEATNLLTLNSRQLDVTKIELRDSNSNYLRDLIYFQEPSQEFLVVNFTSVLNENDQFILDIQYTGILQSNFNGIFQKSYGSSGNWFAGSQFQLINARQAFPCYDEPDFRAPIQLSILHEPKYQALSNTRVSRTEPSGNYQRTVFEPSPPTPIYLISFFLSEFISTGLNNNQVVERIFARPEIFADSERNLILRETESIFVAFRNYLQRNFPSDRIDHVAIDSFDPEFLSSPGEIKFF